jgi:hypothetical protein
MEWNEHKKDNLKGPGGVGKLNEKQFIWGASWNLSRVFNTILYKSEFQDPQIFQQTISLFPEHSTLVRGSKCKYLVLSIIRAALRV